MEDKATDPVLEVKTSAPNDAQTKSRFPEIPVAERAEISSQLDLDRALLAHQRWIDGVLDPMVEIASGRGNFAGLDLRPFKLQGVNLSGANLSGCIMTGMDLTLTNFTVANLTGAQLQDTNLQGAKLTRAKITKADLRGADLTGAQLTGIDLSQAILKIEDLEPKTKSKSQDTTAEQNPS